MQGLIPPEITERNAVELKDSIKVYSLIFLLFLFDLSLAPPPCALARVSQAPG